MKLQNGDYCIINDNEVLFLGCYVGKDSEGWKVFELLWNLTSDSLPEEVYDGFRNIVIESATSDLVDKVLNILEGTSNEFSRRKR